jgi:hypothetical protein
MSVPVTVEAAVPFPAVVVGDGPAGVFEALKERGLGSWGCFAELFKPAGNPHLAVVGAAKSACLDFASAIIK